MIVFTIPKYNSINIEITKPNGELVPLTKVYENISTDKIKIKTQGKNDKIELIASNFTEACRVNVCYWNEIEEIENKRTCNVRNDEVFYEIGPLEEEDHGNWIISNEFKDQHGVLTEIFKVISIEIIGK